MNLSRLLAERKRESQVRRSTLNMMIKRIRVRIWRKLNQMVTISSSWKRIELILR